MTDAVRVKFGMDFWRFWTGQTVSSLGSSFTSFVLPLLVYKLTGSALNLALSTASNYIPYLLFGLVAGAWADRVNRKRLMIAADLLRAAVVLSVPLLWAMHILGLGWIYAVVFLNSTLSIFFDAAQFAALPSLVPRSALVAANGRQQAGLSGANVLGPILAGLLANVFPIQTLLLVDSTSFCVSALSLVLITQSFNADKRPLSTLRQDVVEGLLFVVGQPVLRNIALMAAILNFVNSSTYSQLVLFATWRFHASDPQIGLLYSVEGIGIVLLSLTANWFRRRWGFSRVLLGASMAKGVSLITMAMTKQYWLALPMWSLSMGFTMLFAINTRSLRQAIVPGAMLGRVQTVSAVLAWSANPVGAFVGGVLTVRTQNVALVYGGVGLVTFLTALLFSFTALGRAERYLPEASTVACSSDT